MARSVSSTKAACAMLHTRDPRSLNVAPSPHLLRRRLLSLPCARKASLCEADCWGFVSLQVLFDDLVNLRLERSIRSPSPFAFHAFTPRVANPSLNARPAHGTRTPLRFRVSRVSHGYTCGRFGEAWAALRAENLRTLAERRVSMDSRPHRWFKIAQKTCVI